MHFDAEWDAKDMSCGDLVLDLRSRLRKMPGKVLKVIARDPGAPSDLPAWCKMTGDELVHQDPVAQAYWIRARL
ncbi:MAG: sulfurtransferase TusA family protein [Gallionellaceae bacterium]|nr:sulfurtransferase TusA family protein [Gallionellaceae bacterium]